MLDLDFGTYPYVTSSSTAIGGVCTGLGIPPKRIGKTIGVVKAYTTRVGGGPFPTELLDDTGSHLQEVGAEWGVTTGRRRRCGWLDLVVLKHSCLINGYDTFNLTKLDVLDALEEINIGIGYVVDGVLLDGFPGTRRASPFDSSLTFVENSRLVCLGSRQSCIHHTSWLEI